jgi:hypothetical protein
VSNISIYAAERMLNWSLKASTYASPAGMFVGLSLGAPSSAASSEVGAGSGYVRQTMTFAGAATPTGSASASNSIGATFGAFSSIATVSGLFLADTVSSGAGNMLWFGNLATVRTPLANDQLVLAAGALSITLS